MSPMLCLLKEMRGRLGMYLGVSSLVRLAAFLRGYDHALHQFDNGTHDNFLPVFRDWIHRRFQSSQRSWEETILLHSADEADAIKRFWELLDEYLQEDQRAAIKSEPFEINGTICSAGERADKTDP